MKEWTLNEVTLNHSVTLHTNSENAMIHVPVGEIISSGSRSEIENGSPVRMASLLFRNMSGLLPERLREEINMINSRSAQKNYGYAKFNGRNIYHVYSRRTLLS